MDIFSLISSPEKSADDEHDASSSDFSPGSTAAWSSPSSAQSTPRSLFSSPRTPRRRRGESSSESAPEDILASPCRNLEESFAAESNEGAEKSPSFSPSTPTSPTKIAQKLERAKSRRNALHEERLKSIDSKSKEREKTALRLQQDFKLNIVSKARAELAKSPKAKERRDEQVQIRIESVESRLVSKVATAERNVQRNLLDKQRRASSDERKARAEQRRRLFQYEKRAKLLASLSGKLERAAERSKRLNEEKASRAAEEISHSKEIARRVRAAKLIQGRVRDAYGLECRKYAAGRLSEHEAAERLQTWMELRGRVCVTRMNDDVVEALTGLMELFPSESDTKLPFELICRKMMEPCVMKMAGMVVDCLRPIMFQSSNCPSPDFDSRRLLSLCLIACHPREVLDDSSGNSEDGRSTKGTRLLALSCKAFLESLRELVEIEPGSRTERVIAVASSGRKAFTLFNWWKGMDLDKLLGNLSTQLEQSWVVYISSSEILVYLEKVAGIPSEPKQDDPLMSLRMRHEAGKTGSRNHIKRIRLSLNKLVGSDQAKEVVKGAKQKATSPADFLSSKLRDEVDEIRSTSAAASAPSLVGTAKDSGNVGLSVELPESIASNVELVHRILLTDPCDFDKLSWDGTDAHAAALGPYEFMASFSISQESSDGTPRSLEDVPQRIAQSMRYAFLNQSAQEARSGNFAPARDLLREMSEKMRSLLPNRQDLHSHISDADVMACKSIDDVVRITLRSSYLLANYLESAARASTTNDLIRHLEEFAASREDTTGSPPAEIPFGLESEELFALSSVAFVIYKAQVCSADISNYKLGQLAPLLHHAVGCEYERKQLKEAYGDYTVSTAAELQGMLSSTCGWIRSIQSRFGSAENLTAQSKVEQKLDFVKGRGFVEGILFTRTQLALPEVFSLDAERIGNIRNEAKCCVIASALVLHAGNICKLKSSELPALLSPGSEVEEAKRVLFNELRRKHFDQTELESNVTKSVYSLATAVIERDLSDGERDALSNHTNAVLRGNDPVLNLLDNRIQNYYKFACKWTKPVGSAPLEMKTGRSVLANGAPAPGVGSTKDVFIRSCLKEARKLGFGFVADDLIESSHMAHMVIGLACANYWDVFHTVLSA